MAWVVIQLDDFETTHSTGGVVIDVQPVSETMLRSQWPTEKLGSDKIIKECSDDDVKVGWIYTDKTHQIIDSNKKG